MVLLERILAVQFNWQRCLLKPSAITNHLQARQVNMTNLSNKRITRLESDIELEDPSYKTRLINRNPRNLEQMSFEYKPKGFWLEKSAPASWNKLVLKQSGRYLDAFLLHWSGHKIIQASTREPQLSKYFNNPNTTQAAKVLAEVIARRCLQGGYLCAGVDTIERSQDAGVKTRTFFDTIEANGILLEEPPEITPRCVTDV